MSSDRRVECPFCGRVECDGYSCERERLQEAARYLGQGHLDQRIISAVLDKLMERQKQERKAS